MCQTQILKKWSLWSSLQTNFLIFCRDDLWIACWCLKTTFACWTRAQRQQSDTSGSSERHLHNRDERCKQMKEGGEWNNNSDWHGWSWPTRVTLTAGSSCCYPPSLPPSCLTQLMSKLGPVQSIQCGRGRKHHVVPPPPFWRSRLMIFFVRDSTWKLNMLHKISAVTLLYSTARLEPAILQKRKWISKNAQREAVPIKSLTKNI